ncbi:MAG: T9SS type A sorting domain-containing protein, partial [Bacteroidota bacterium]|nr:T9SS type A sorting domain-containing protein [Bacteroidota bacterium]
NWVAPDPFQGNNPSYTLSDSRYWKIDGILPSTFDGKFKFNYNNKENGTGWLDYTWFPYPLSADSLVLLYREGCWNNWAEISFVRLGNSRSGWLITEEVNKGEYCLAYRDLTLSYSLLIKDDKKMLTAFPNPSKDILNVHIDLNQKKELKLYDSRGVVVYSKKMPANKNFIQIKVDRLMVGVYFLELQAARKKKAEIKVVISR